jgi:hypothetical protein
MSDLEMLAWIYGGLFIVLGVIYRQAFVMFFDDMKRLVKKNG